MIHNGIQMRLAADASEELSSAFLMPLVPPGGWGDVGHLHVSLSPLMAARTLAESASPCRTFLISFSLNRKPSSRLPPPFHSKLLVWDLLHEVFVEEIAAGNGSFRAKEAAASLCI